MVLQKFLSLFCLSVMCIRFAESKLNRLKGIDRKKEPVAKDIIGGLDKLRLCHMRMLTDIDLTMPYVRNTDYVDESASSATVVDLLKRRIAPEKQAINEEELKKLVENDELLLTSMAMEQPPDANNTTCVKDADGRQPEADAAADDP